jgi:hypothetical protein
MVVSPPSCGSRSTPTGLKSFFPVPLQISFFAQPFGQSLLVDVETGDIVDRDRVHGSLPFGQIFLARFQLGGADRQGALPPDLHLQALGPRAAPGGLGWHRRPSERTPLSASMSDALSGAHQAAGGALHSRSAAGSSAGVTILTHGESVRICSRPLHSTAWAAYWSRTDPTAVSRAAKTISNGAFDTLYMTLGLLHNRCCRREASCPPGPANSGTFGRVA